MTEYKHVYTIIEKEGQEKSRWVRVGVAFVNRDKSLNIRLNALPINGLLHVRDPYPGTNGKQEEGDSVVEETA